MTMRPPRCSRATAATASSRCFSTWRAGRPMRSPDGAERNPGPASPHSGVEPVVGRRFAPPCWRLHAGYGTPAFSPRRVAAMVLRYWYLLRSSWPRLLDLVYWPAVQMLMWGFLQLYIGQNAGFFARAGGIFIGAVLLWDILFRGHLGFSLSFLEEMWSRNLANLMISPLRPAEFILALIVMSLTRLAISTKDRKSTRLNSSHRTS